MAVVWRLLRYEGSPASLVRHLARRGVVGKQPGGWTPGLTIEEVFVTGMDTLIEEATKIDVDDVNKGA